MARRFRLMTPTGKPDSCSLPESTNLLHEAMSEQSFRQPICRLRGRRKDAGRRFHDALLYTSELFPARHVCCRAGHAHPTRRRQATATGVRTPVRCESIATQPPPCVLLLRLKFRRERVFRGSRFALRVFSPQAPSDPLPFPPLSASTPRSRGGTCRRHPPQGERTASNQSE